MLTSLSGSGIAVSCGVDHRRGLDLVLLWLWCRLAAAVPIQPLAWKLPYATSVALKSKKKKKKRKRSRTERREVKFNFVIPLTPKLALDFRYNWEAVAVTYEDNYFCFTVGRSN